MRETFRIPLHTGFERFQSRRGSLIVTLIIFIVLLSFALLPVIAFTWIREPSTGSFAGPGLFTLYKSWLRSTQSIYRIIYFAVPYFLGLVYLTCGLYLFILRREEIASQVFAVFSATTAISLAALFDVITTQYLFNSWILGIVFSGATLLHFGLIFLDEDRLIRKFASVYWIGYILAALLAGITFLIHTYSFTSLAFLSILRLDLIFTGLSLLVFSGLLIFSRFKSSSPVVREQARMILWGSLVAFGPLVVQLLISLVKPLSMTGFIYSLLPVGIFPVVIVYSIKHYRKLDTDYILSRALLYTLLSVLVAFSYVLLTGGLSLIFGETLHPTNPFVIGLMILLLASGLEPLRQHLQQSVDKIFLRRQALYSIRLQEFNYELTQAMDLPVTLGILRRYASRELEPACLYIFIYDSLSDHFMAYSDDSGRSAIDIRFPQASPLVQILSKGEEAIFLTEKSSGSQVIQADKARLALLGSQVIIPIMGRKRLIGWLAVGQRRSGASYANRDINFLFRLCSQASLGIERAQMVMDLEHRIHEMNVLSRVAQGTNFTVAFDDVMELIYAQTSQVISSWMYRVSLYNKKEDILKCVFFLQDDERITEQEGCILNPLQGLEMEILRSQQPLLALDYVHKCRDIGVSPYGDGIFAWMGVPLIAGSEVIGVISLGSHDSSAVYTLEQRNLFQAIADQAAGAIVKAQLIEETERKARQLATLNEIGRSLTSNLEPKNLLNQILKSATEILNCVAGSLFLLDEQTGEMVFEVVIGPVAFDLLGKKLPAGAGLVGEAVMTGKPIIANEAKRRKEWFNQTDLQTGFDTQDMLVVPMKVQEKVIGVIEVINKRDGAPFTTDDQDLLATFTSQATVAIENARLYTLTDQALAARVEELSVMQRIDRELNASLDIERSMQITLDWAMQQSHADAGLVGIIDQDDLQVMVSQGYTSELDAWQTSTSTNADHIPGWKLPIQAVGLISAIETGQPQFIVSQHEVGQNGNGGRTGESFLLEGTLSQFVIPIRREEKVIGVIWLESRSIEDCPEETINFISRLSDHAAIAISNAQLYGEVKEANLAKSKFVSFVAHELKNPMASIKGYTELVAGGMAGPVNDLQASFLATVRANVERMNTIVSDLNDLTKIQVGSLRLEYKAVNIRDSVEEVLRSMRRQLEEKEHLVLVNLPESLPMVWADPNRITQILTNLVSNAVKYTQLKGEITIQGETLNIDKDTSESVQKVHVIVRDNGIGIPLEDQEKIFQQYFRTEASKEIAPGTGLGLNITRSLIEMQGGKIWFESIPQKGTTFHFTIPVMENN